jgi:ribosomal protein S18 acetylase RimI-like enzyme
VASIGVRPAHPDELELVGEICVTAYVSGGHLTPGDDYETTLRDARGRAATAEILVALRDDRIVGTATICPVDSPYSEVGRPDESEFRFLAVAPEAWRSGVGEALIAECETLARQRGQVAHVICVIDRNTAAHRFYERLGFTRFPERDWVPVPGVNLQAYRRPIPYEPG